MIDDRLAISVIHSDGTVDRWGPDEPDGHDVPDDLTFTTSIPGGFKDMSCALTREFELYPDENLFDEVIVYGPGNDIAWEGRMDSFPRNVGSINPTAVGWMTHLTDNSSARDIWIDADLSQWSGPSLTRQGNLFTSGLDCDSPSGVAYDPQGSSGLDTRLSDAWPRGHRCEAWYLGQGIPLGILYYGWTKGVSINAADSNWNWQAQLSDTDTPANSNQSAPLEAVGPGFGSILSSGVAKFTALAFMEYKVAGGTQGQIFDIYWTALAVVGTHGLPMYGTASPTTTPGLIVSDIIQNVVTRWAPLLNFTYPGSIERTSFIVPHFVQYTATTSDQIISAANAFELKDWGVYSGGEEGWPSKTFFFREPSATRLTWRVRRSDGATLTNQGVQAADCYNGVIVNFTTPDGVAHTVGPPGSGCQYTSTLLTDPDPTNPVTASGFIKYGALPISAPTSLGGAIQMGAIWLIRRVGVQVNGTLNFTGKVKHPSGALYPAWRVRSGDYIIVEDDPRDPTPRKIINTNYTHSSRAMSCDLEHPVFRLDAMIARNAVVTGAGVSG